MSLDFEKEPNYEPLFQTLIDKTKAGKLAWQETAEENTYIAAVKGQQTYEISLRNLRPIYASANTPVPVLTVKDHEGRVFLQTTEESSSETAKELFYLARRVAMNLDERIESSLELLNQL